jgi:DNA polymerase
MIGSLDARVVIVGQDFAAADWKPGAKPWPDPDPKLPTNINLRKLIRAAGLEERDVYLTNAVLCLKHGDRMSAPVQAGWARNCSPLLRGTIDLVAPEAVAALGGVAWRAVGLAFDVRLPPLKESAGREAVRAEGHPALFAFNHPGGLGLVRRPLITQVGDWQMLGRWLAANRRNAA